MAGQAITIPTAVRTAVRESLRLIEQTRRHRDRAAKTPNPDPLPSLLEQCGRLAGIGEEPAVEPIRTIHHFACTGGTLMAKCIASMPNTQLLSEVEPHSSIPPQRRSKFAPTDMIGLLRGSSRGSDSGLESRLFLAALEALHEDCMAKGLRLVLRDHAHSSYCTGKAVSTAPNLRRLLGDRYALNAVVTVRHPLDSWLSLNNNGWVHFQPGSLDEYAARYQRFLDEHAELPIFRYEDFVDHPDDQIQNICSALDVPYAADYQLLFSIHQFSGDSGRSSDVIGHRPRRAVPGDIAEAAHASAAYRGLCGRLGYEP